MPNGKAGDHPVTDITVHGSRVFSPEIDALVVELDALGFWRGAVASEWIYSARGDYENRRRTGTRGEADRFLAHLQDVLEQERERLGESN